MGKTNDRCPLQAECERKCSYIGRELDCPYYDANARPGYEIDDQEERRRAEWKKAEEAEYEARMEKEMREAAKPDLSPVPYERTIEIITSEIWLYKRQLGESILEIGQRLIEAKSRLPHGEWLPWLSEKVDFSETTAQRFMKVARGYSNPALVTDLGLSKAMKLLELPDSDRYEFIGETHSINGSEKTVFDMSKRELEQAIKDRDEARKAAETAKAEASLAEQSRAKMEADMAMTKETLRALLEEKKRADQDVYRLQQELDELQSRPVDVAVETVVDPEAIAQARAEAVAEMQAKLDKAKAAKAKAEEKRKEAEAALEQAQVQLKDAEQARKNAALSSDEDMATFKVLFQQSQETANKMRGILLKLRNRPDGTAAQGAEKAMKALAEAIGRCAE